MLKYCHQACFSTQRHVHLKDFHLAELAGGAFFYFSDPFRQGMMSMSVWCLGSQAFRMHVHREWRKNEFPDLLVRKTFCLETDQRPGFYLVCRLWVRCFAFLCWTHTAPATSIAASATGTIHFRLGTFDDGEQSAAPLSVRLTAA